MTNQESFEIQAKEVLDRNQFTLDQKLFLSHWGGYAQLKSNHKKEIADLAKKLGVKPNFKKWKLRGSSWFIY